ncbi:MAG: protein of unknown function (DUF385) [Chloroflexi bacterium]|jgi:deazaflavin-dependent oxidoreductase (nitroreductase family)|nr:MAG: protein of unknown function (DUF385) [Chloroflexota bacterium]
MPDPNEFNTQVIAELRANQGKAAGPFEGAPMIILHTTGAKSGGARVKPLMYQAVGQNFAVFASYAGADKSPAWFHNLVAHPDITVEVDGATLAVTARVTEGAERESIWTTQKQRYSVFADYEAKTDREIPVVLLERQA